MKKTRFFLMIGVIMISFLSLQTLYGGSRSNVKPLPAPQRKGGLPLMEALDKRMSIRDYSDKQIPEQVLSNLLWAAWGYNREDKKKRTAPSAMNKQEISIYLAKADGLYLYDAETHGLIKLSGDDIRKETGKQSFVNSAPLNLIFVADMKKQSSLTSIYANTGFISQNVYLYCASEGLGGVVRGWFDEDELHQAMQLGEDQKAILCHTVGYPAE